jgi:hypothetical protein
LTGQSTGDVQGVKRASLVADMRDIQTSVDATLFDLPTGLTKLTEEEIKQQVSAIGQFLQFALSAINSRAGGGGGGMPTAPPASGTMTPGGASPGGTTSSPVPSPTR